MQDLNEEAFEVSTTLWIQSIFQGNIVFLQVHVLHCIQVSLWVINITLLSPQNLISLHIFCLWIGCLHGPKLRPKFVSGDLVQLTSRLPCGYSIWLDTWPHGYTHRLASERPTMMRMSVSSSVPTPFMAALRRRAKYSCGFLAHLTIEHTKRQQVLLQEVIFHLVFHGLWTVLLYVYNLPRVI